MNPSIALSASGQTYAGCSRDDKLTDFLRTAASREFRLGDHDCGLWAADWFMAVTGRPDPAAHLRGASYGADELMHHMLPIIASLGLRRTHEPERGDIGIMALGRHHIGAIFGGEQWMTFGERGIRALPKVLRSVHAWKVA